MMFPIPRSDKQARFCEPVLTVDSQYDIVDFGLQHADGSIDSLAIGGAFTSAKRWYKEFDERNDGIVAAEMQLSVDEHAVKNDLPFINVDGTDVPEEQQRKVATTV